MKCIVLSKILFKYYIVYIGMHMNIGVIRSTAKHGSEFERQTGPGRWREQLRPLIFGRSHGDIYLARECHFVPIKGLYYIAVELHQIDVLLHFTNAELYLDLLVALVIELLQKYLLLLWNLLALKDLNY